MDRQRQAATADHEPDDRAGAPSPDADDGDLDNGRIISLSDGIFAFAMTLMVLQFNEPDPEKVSGAALRRYVLEQWPSLFSYVLTFFVVANYWVIHHRTFRYIRTHDMVLVWINIAFLLCVSFLPFPTNVMGDYYRAPFATQFYAAAMAVTSAVMGVLWFYLGRQRHLLQEGCDERTIRHGTVRALATCAIFLGSIPVAHFDVDAARLCWALLFPAHFFIARALGHGSLDLVAV
jgi:uncharacterized membrane protein